jgi:hypothetical protein
VGSKPLLSVIHTGSVKYQTGLAIFNEDGRVGGRIRRKHAKHLAHCWRLSKGAIKFKGLDLVM